MRTLVEQTEENIKRYLENLVSNADNLGITDTPATLRVVCGVVLGFRA